MDTVSIIMAAIIAGATSGLAQGTGGVINKAFEDAYVALKNLLIEKSLVPEETKKILDTQETDKQSWKDSLRENIIKYQLDKSEEIFKLAEKMLLLLIENQQKSQPTDFAKMVSQLNAYGGKVIIVSGNINRIDM